MDNETKVNEIKNTILKYFSTTIGEETDIYQLIQARMNNLQINIMERDDFRTYYEERMGIGTVIPSGFYDHQNSMVVLRNANFKIPVILETAIHETIHALSDNGNNKLGLLQYDDKIGRGFNEMATCYITSKILGKGKGGSYSKDYHEVFKLFLETTKMSEDELFAIFFGDENWITKEMSERFDKKNPDSLKQLLSIYDGRTRKEFDPNLVLKIIEQSASINGISNESNYKNSLNSFCEYFDIHMTDEEKQEIKTSSEKKISITSATKNALISGISDEDIDKISNILQKENSRSDGEITHG